MSRDAANVHLHGDWKTLSRRERAEWVAEHGPLCPGWGRAAHWVTEQELTVDHVVPRSREVLAVLCRSCNGRKADR